MRPKYLIFGLTFESSNVKRREEKEKKKKRRRRRRRRREVCQRYGSLEFGMDYCMEFVRILGFIKNMYGVIGFAP